ncbi:MAG: hypothetical protein M3N50_14250 [Pseudomonadota bacterium]|nr:hypothetical protein [Pseudomonadota bacterium]
MLPLQLRARIVPREPRDRAVDQPRIKSLTRAVSQAQPIHHARAKILDQDIGAGHQAARDFQILHLLQIQRDALLTSLEHRICRIIPPRSRRRIDANDLRALIGHHQRGKRAGDVMTKIYDSKAAQRRVGGLQGWLYQLETLCAYWRLVFVKWEFRYI